MSSDYTPIDCAQYCRFELAIMHRQRLRIAWRAEDGCSHLDTLLPINLNTRNHVEYLLGRTPQGQDLELRLDRIIRAEPRDET